MTTTSKEENRKPSYIEGEKNIRIEFTSDPLRRLNDNSDDVVSHFRRDGYAIFPRILTSRSVDLLNDHLELVLRGSYDIEGSEGPDVRRPGKLVRSPLPNQKEEQQQRQESSSSRGGCGDGRGRVTKSRAKKRYQKVGPLGYSGNHRHVKLFQLVNVRKCDSVFRELVECEVLGEIVSKLMGWHDNDDCELEGKCEKERKKTYQFCDEYDGVTDGGGARVAQDQVWAKPPGAPSLAFHRDSPYFEPFFPQEVVATVWIALDDMDPEIGPLVYVPGSHLWPKGGDEDEEVQLGDNEDEEVKSGENGRPSTSGTRILRDFFNKDNSEGNDNFNIKGKDGKMSENNVAKLNKNAGIGSYNEEARHYPQVALRQAAKNSGHDPDELEYISTSGLKAGGLSIHDGRTWHGSGPNASPFFRPITADNKALRGHSSNSSPNPRPRRGIGIHYVPVNARWKSDLAVGSQIWGRYVDGDTGGNSSDSGNCDSNGGLEQLNDTFFPIAWSPSSR